MRRRLAVFLMVGVLLAGASVGSAEEASSPGADPRAAARPLAAEAMKAYEAGDYARAEQLFAEADARYPAPQYRLYLARALAKAGRLGAAAAAYRSVMLLPAPFDAPPSFTDAQKVAIDELAALRGKVGVLALVLNGDGVAGAEVRLDGIAWPAAEHAGREVDPGEHRVTVSGEGLVATEQSVSAAAGQRTRVELSARRKVLAPAPEPSRAEVEASLGLAPAPRRTPTDAVQRETEKPRGSRRWHEGQLGVVARGDFDVLHGGLLGAPGLTYGLWGPLELNASALLSGHVGAEGGLTWYVLDGAWKPLLVVAAPVFFEGGALVGARTGVGLQWDASREIGAFASVSAVYFPSLPEELEAFYVLPSVGVQGRL